MSYSPLSAAELERYFTRIGFTGKAGHDLATLQQLHYLHPIAIPFENLDSWGGQCPSLEQTAVFTKLVDDARGGYCFEHNQLFMRVLVALGFMVRGLSARVIIPDGALPRTHMTLGVHCEQQSWLVDVGFGGLTMTTPLNLQSDGEQSSSHERWRLEKHPAAYMLHAQWQGKWQPMYCFSLEVQSPGDYQMANWYVATFPDSRFTRELIVACPDAIGRHALLDRRYTRHRLGQPSVETQMQSARELHDLLRDVFRIDTRRLLDLERRLDARLFSPTVA